MADPKKLGLLASLRQLGRSLVNLGRAFEGKEPMAAPIDDAPPQAQALPELPLLLTAPEEHFEDAQLLSQHTPGWHGPHPTRLPVPTYAPAMTAFGIVFIALGAVTVWPLSLVGAAIFILAVAKWIGELLHD